MATVLLQCPELLLAFHSFGRHRQPHRFAQVDDGLDHGAVAASGVVQPADEAFVDLDAVERVGAQVAQRRVAGAEVVHVQANAQLFERQHCAQCAFDVIEHHVLGNFQLQALCGESGFQQDLAYIRHHIAALELRR